MFLGLCRGVHPPKPARRLPSCLQVRPLHRSREAACILEKIGRRKHEKHACFSWKLGEGRLRGKRVSYLSIYLYRIPIIFKKNIKDVAHLVILLVILCLLATPRFSVLQQVCCLSVCCYATIHFTCQTVFRIIARWHWWHYCGLQPDLSVSWCRIFRLFMFLWVFLLHFPLSIVPTLYVPCVRFLY